MDAGKAADFGDVVVLVLCLAFLLAYARKEAGFPYALVLSLNRGEFFETKRKKAAEKMISCSCVEMGSAELFRLLQF